MKNVKNNEQNAVQQNPNRKVIDLQDIKCEGGFGVSVQNQVGVYIAIIPTDSFMYNCAFDVLDLNDVMSSLMKVVMTKDNKIYTSGIIKTETGNLWEFELRGIVVEDNGIHVRYELVREIPYWDVEKNNNKKNKED